MKNFNEIPETEIFDLLDGFMAYDTGFTDSGIRDDKTKNALIEWLKSELEKPENNHRLLPPILNRFAAQAFFTDEAMSQGYGLEDCREFMRWLEDNGIVEFS